MPRRIIRGRGRGRGKGGRVAQSRSDLFDAEVSFELFTLDENGNLRTPELEFDGIHTPYTFPGAIENFTGTFSESGDNFGFDPIGIVQPAEDNDNPPTVSYPYPLELDLTARYLPEGSTITLPDGTNAVNAINFPTQPPTPIVADSDRIEYVLTSEVLENLGINELTLVLKDANKVETGFQFRKQTIEIEEAISNIEYIVDNRLLLLDQGDGIRVSGVSSSDFNHIVSLDPTDEASPSNFPTFAPLVIEAEDLVGEASNYSIEEYGDEGDQLISLLGGERNPGGQIVGEVKFKPEDFDIDFEDFEIRSLTISTFDEDDGASTIEVYVNDVLVNEPVVLNETPAHTGNGLPNEEIRVGYVFNLSEFGVDGNLSGVSSNDEITIRGISDGTEWARIDYLILDEKIPPALIEAEDLVREAESGEASNYSIEEYGDEGDELISLLGGERNSEGQIVGEVKFKPEDFDIDFEIGSLTISTFDEDDGASTIEVYVNDVLVNEPVVLNETPAHTGNGLPNEEIRVGYVFNLSEFGVDGNLSGVSSNDEITIRGISDGTEWARIDYLILDEINSNII